MTAEHQHHRHDHHDVSANSAIDPVCGMTVNADAGSHPLELDGTTYWFCCVGCHDRFAADPARYLSTDSLGQEA